MQSSVMFTRIQINKISLARHACLFKDMHFVAIDPLKCNNTINSLLINPNIILHYSLSLNIYEY